MRLIPIWSAAGASCLLAAAALPAAGTTAPDADGIVDLPIYEVDATKVASHSAVGTKINTSILETPQSVSVVTRAELDLRGVQRLTDAVAYTAGVQAEFQGTDSRTDTLKIRGYDTGGFTSNIYLDGLRPASGGQWTRAQFDTFGLDRVEVVKGPSAVLYGQVSPGGLINLVSKRPSAVRHQEVGLQVSSHDTWQGTLDVGGPIGSGAVRIRLVGLFRDGDAEVDHTSLRRAYLAPSLSWQIGKNTSLTLLAQFQEDDGGSTYQFLPQTGTLKPGAGGFRLDTSTFLGEPEWNLFERTQYTLGYQFEHALNGTFIVRQSLRFMANETEYRAMVGTPADATPAGDYTRRAIRGTGDTEGLAVDTHLQAGFATGSIAHTLVAGIDVTHSDWWHLRQINSAVPAINIYAPAYNPGIGATISAGLTSQSDQSVTERQVGLYVQEQAVIGRLHATLGLRHDWYSIDSADPVTGTLIDEAPESTTWRAGLLYLLDNGLAPYASYTTSFDTAPYTYLDLANQPLGQPTKANQFEVGFKYKPSGVSALFTAAFFELTESNRVVVIQPTPARYSQIGEARVRGLELEARIELLRGFDAVASWTLLDSEVTRTSGVSPAAPGNDLPAVPDQIASLWLSHTATDGPLRGLTLGGGIRYVGSSFGNDANSIAIPSYTLADASLSYDLGKAFPGLQGAHLRLSATNLADKRYVAYSTQPGAAWYGSGRNVSLSIRFSW